MAIDIQQLKQKVATMPFTAEEKELLQHFLDTAQHACSDPNVPVAVGAGLKEEKPFEFDGGGWWEQLRRRWS